MSKGFHVDAHNISEHGTPPGQSECDPGQAYVKIGELATPRNWMLSRGGSGRRLVACTDRAQERSPGSCDKGSDVGSGLT